MPRPVVPEDRLRSLAVGFVDIARSNDLRKLVTEQEIDDVRVEITIERKLIRAYDDEGSAITPEFDEHVTVKTGPKSRPAVAVSIPARWLA